MLATLTSYALSVLGAFFVLMIWSGVIVVVERIRARLENRIPADEEFNGPAILNIYKFGFFTIMMATLITIPVVGNLLFLVGPFLRDGIAAGMIACTIIMTIFPLVQHLKCGRAEF